MNRDSIVSFLDEKLSIDDIPDDSNNGLQVCGVSDVSKIGLAVDACMEAYENAVTNSCQMLIVHHGLIWNGIDYVTGRNYNHLKYLLDNDLNLYAAHLPLDLHSEIGNNTGLAKILPLKNIEKFGQYKTGVEIGLTGLLKEPMTCEDISQMMQSELGGKSEIFKFGKDLNKRIGIVSGRGSSVLDQAVNAGFDCFITGEGIYESYHLSKEARMNMIYLGHYHSEQVGVKSLGKILEKKFNIETVYLDETML